MPGDISSRPFIRFCEEIAGLAGYSRRHLCKEKLKPTLSPGFQLVQWFGWEAVSSREALALIERGEVPVVTDKQFHCKNSVYAI
jgi:hypothetical protein